MLQPLSNIIDQKKTAAWDEPDARHFIQRWLRERTHTEKVYCVSFTGGVATIQAASPAIRQMATILEFDLQEAMTAAGGPGLKGVKVIR